MSDLVQILPPLRQSYIETAACPRAYVEIVINGKAQPDSIPSERGQDIHHVMSEYVRHCSRNKLDADWAYFNKLSASSGPDAGPILDGIRDRYVVDWQHVYNTEVTLALDEEFAPTDITEEAEHRFLLEPGVNYSGKPAAYTGTLDVILLSDDCRRAKINDYKSHPAVFDADTPQATMYAFMLFKHLPDLLNVTFELDFVRYKNCYRAVVFQRSEMPAMQAEIERYRERQRITHANPEEAKALPCKVCVYCPLAKNFSCPIAEWNEHTAMTLPQRLMWKEWMRRLSGINSKVLKEHASVTGPVRYEDGNGKVFEYGEREVPSTRYPLDSTSIQLLTEWKAVSGEDLLDGTLNISSTKLKQRLKTIKRSALREKFEESSIETSTKPKFVVNTPDEGIIEEFNPYEQED